MNILNVDLIFQKPSRKKLIQRRQPASYPKSLISAVCCKNVIKGRKPGRGKNVRVALGNLGEKIKNE